MCNQTSDDSPWPLVKRVASLLHSWWRGDRIRSPPAEGRLLRLRPPCYLLLRGQSLEVTSREVQERGGKMSVVYVCQTRGGQGNLVVEPGTILPAVMSEWHENGKVVRLPEADVEVFCADG